MTYDQVKTAELAIRQNHAILRKLDSVRPILAASQRSELRAIEARLQDRALAPSDWFALGFMQAEMLTILDHSALMSR